MYPQTLLACCVCVCVSKALWKSESVTCCKLCFMRVTFMKWRAVSGGEGQVMPSDSLQTSNSQTDGVTSHTCVCVCVPLWHSLACSTGSGCSWLTAVSSCSVELNTSSRRWHWRVLQKTWRKCENSHNWPGQRNHIELNKLIKLNKILWNDL